MTVLSRIKAALAANAFGQAVTLATQIFLIPLFFKCWGGTVYGEWLILSSIPAYLTMADAGIGPAASNEMMFRSASGDSDGARQTYQASMWIARIAAILTAAIATAIAWPTSTGQISLTSALDSKTSAAITLLLAGAVGCGFIGGIYTAALKCLDRNALAVTIVNTGRLLESISVALILIGGNGPLWAAAAAFATKLLANFVQLISLRFIGTNIIRRSGRTNLILIKRLGKPAFGFLAFPLGNALALQGPIFLIGAVFGGAAVATYSATRTFTRIPMQLTNLLNASIWTEISRAHGMEDTSLLQRLHRVSVGTTAILIFLTSITQIFFGSYIISFWLGKSLVTDSQMLIALVLTAAISAGWNASSIVLVATSRHLKLGGIYVATNSAMLLCASYLSKHYGWPGMLWPLVFTEILLTAWVLPTVLRQTNDLLIEFLAAIGTEMRTLPGRLLHVIR